MRKPPKREPSQTEVEDAGWNGRGNGLVAWEEVILPAFVKDVPINYLRLLDVAIGFFLEKLCLGGWFH